MARSNIKKSNRIGYGRPGSYRNVAALAANLANAAVYTALTRSQGTVLAPDTPSSSKHKMVDEIMGTYEQPAKRIFAGSKRAGGKLGGFMKARKNPRRTKRYKKYGRNGISTTLEAGGSITDGRCLVLGNATHPRTPIMKIAWMSVLKDLLRRAGFQITSLTRTLPGRSPGDVFIISYYKADNSTMVEESFAYNDKSPNQFADWAIDPTRGFNSGNSDRVQFFEISIRTVSSDPGIATAIIPEIAPARMKLEQYIVHIKAKSTFKVQNRTIINDAVGDDSAQDVDNQPLVGKIYTGTTTGNEWRKRKTLDFTLWSDVNTGVLSATANDSGPQEPPNGYEFKRTNKTSKVRLNPGLVKTATLTCETAHNLSRLHNVYFPIDSNDKTYDKIGKHQMLCLEKILHAESSEAAIQLFYEHNLNLYCVGKNKNNNVVVRAYSQTLDNNVGT